MIINVSIHGTEGTNEFAIEVDGEQYKFLKKLERRSVENQDDSGYDPTIVFEND